MTAEGVFLVGEHGLVEMQGSTYDAEEELQGLLERHPALLSGRHIDPAAPRHWLLLSRETGVPDADGAADRWSADHLFVDQDGIPTIVEVKRSTDTRIRREVVGQMLDYAANGVRYWPPERLRALLEQRAGSADRADDQVRDLLNRGDGASLDVEEFWAQVDDNLRAGRLRLLFVADVIPASLQRIIEFLNEQMTDCEVLGVEIRQYATDGHRIFAPTVVGRTSQAQQTKRNMPDRTFDEKLEAAPEVVVRTEQLLSAWALRHGLAVTTSKAARQYRNVHGQTLCQLYDDGSVEFYIGELAASGLPELAQELLEELAAFAQRRLTSRHPWLRADALVEGWERLEDQWLPRYVEAHSRRATLVGQAT